MPSERAKELAAKQKAEAKAAREAKKNSTDPNDWGPIRQIVETVKMTTAAEPKNKWILIACVAGPIAIGVPLGFILHHPIYGSVLGVLGGLALFMWILGILGKSAVYKRYEGQSGAAQVGIMMLPSKKWTYTLGVSFNRAGDSVHRVVGPGGLILVGDGDPSRVKGMLNTEKHRHEQLLYDIEIVTVSCGDGAEQVPVKQLAKYIKKLPKKLTTTQIAEIEVRLRALDSSRPKVPLPRGPMPTMRGTRRMMRGR